MTATRRTEPAALSRRAQLLSALAVAVLCALLVSLGNWQLRRLAWKQDLIASAASRPSAPVVDLPPPAQWPALDIAAAQYRPFRLSGRFLHDREALVFTSLSDQRGAYGGPGYWVVTPFALAGGGTVLVNRGFVPQGRQDPPRPGEVLDGAATELVGLLRPDDTPNPFTPDDRPEDNLFFSRSIGSIAGAKALEAPVAPFSIDLLAAETPAGGLPQAGETRMTFSNSHLGYAVTWYGLAVALLAVSASFAWSRWRRASGGRSLTPPGGAP